MSEVRRRELGETDAPVEEELLRSFNRLVDEGGERLERTFRAMFITGLFGGLEVGVGVVAYLDIGGESARWLRNRGVRDGLVPA